MSKLFRYALRRLIFNKFFLVLLLVIAFYSWKLLDGEIILGVSYTAPFSSWSYGAFLALVLPLLLITLLFFITHLYSRKEKRVRVLAMATPIDPVQYGAVKCLAIATGFLLISGVTIGISFAFYADTFRFYDFGAFVNPIIMTLLPSMLFVTGIGMVAGRIHPALLYALMLLLLLMGKASLPYALDLLGDSFFRTAPLTLPVGSSGEPDFIVPTAVIIGKLGFSLAGILFTGIGLNDFKRKRYT